jgi:nicotinamide riboside transporter PnuC
MQMETAMTELMQVAGVALGLWGNFLIGQRRRSAFVVWGASNIFILAVNVLAGLYIMASLFAVYTGFCAHNYFLWSRDQEARATT